MELKAWIEVVGLTPFGEVGRRGERARERETEREARKRGERETTGCERETTGYQEKRAGLQATPK